jgi:hypothetical protein
MCRPQSSNAASPASSSSSRVSVIAASPPLWSPGQPAIIGPVRAGERPQEATRGRSMGAPTGVGSCSIPVNSAVMDDARNSCVRVRRRSALRRIGSMLCQRSGRGNPVRHRRGGA